MTSVSFYANTTIYIIAGLVAALGASDKLLSFTAELPFGGAGNRELLEIKLMLLLASFVFAYFKFTWSLRQFNLPLHPRRCRGRSARPASRVSTPMHSASPGPTTWPATTSTAAFGPIISASPPRAGCSIRSILGAFAIVVLIVLFRRDYRSPALHILRD